MRHISIPANAQPEVRDAFQQVEEELRRLNVPILSSMRDVESIADGSSCYFAEPRSRTVYKYTKIRNQLIREALGDDELQRIRRIALARAKGLSESDVRGIAESEVENIARPTTVAGFQEYNGVIGIENGVFRQYTVRNDPGNTFNIDWYGGADADEAAENYANGILLAEDQKPTDVRFMPETPSQEPGTHAVRIYFTPRVENYLLPRFYITKE